MRKMYSILYAIVLFVATATVSSATPMYYSFEDTRGWGYVFHFEIDFDRQGYKVESDGTVNVYEDVPYATRHDPDLPVSIRADRPFDDYFFVDYIGGSVSDIYNDYHLGHSKNEYSAYSYIGSNRIWIEYESGRNVDIGGTTVFDPYFVSDWTVGDIMLSSVYSSELAFSPYLLRLTEISLASPVPEPSILIMLGTGIVGLVGYRRKKIRTIP